MIDCALPVQIGVAAALLASTAVTSLIGQAVFDPLQAVNQPYPLIEIGEDQVITNSDGVTDAVWVTIHVWADGPAGRLFVKRVADAVRATLAARGHPSRPRSQSRATQSSQPSITWPDTSSKTIQRIPRPPSLTRIFSSGCSSRPPPNLVPSPAVARHCQEISR